MEQEELKNLTADKTADARGIACPGPLLEAKKALGTVPINGTLELLSGESATKNDLKIWAEKFGHDYLGYIEDDGYDRIFIRRKK